MHARRVVVVAGMVDAIRDALAVEDEKGGGDARAVARSNVDALRLHPPLVVHRRERAIAVVLGRHRVGVALGARHRPRHLRDERARKRGRDERHSGVEIDLDLPRRRAGVRRGLHVIPADECAAQREAQGGHRERRGTAGERPSRHRVPPTARVKPKNVPTLTRKQPARLPLTRKSTPSLLSSPLLPANRPSSDIRLRLRRRLTHAPPPATPYSPPARTFRTAPRVVPAEAEEFDNATRTSSFSDTGPTSRPISTSSSGSSRLMFG